MFGASLHDIIRNTLLHRTNANQIILLTKCYTFQFSKNLSRTPFLQSNRDSPFSARICRLLEPCRYHYSSKLPRSHACGKRKKNHPCYLVHWYVMILESHVNHNLRLLGSKWLFDQQKRQTNIDQMPTDQLDRKTDMRNQRATKKKDRRKNERPNKRNERKNEPSPPPTPPSQWTQMNSRTTPSPRRTDERPVESTNKPTNDPANERTTKRPTTDTKPTRSTE